MSLPIPQIRKRLYEIANETGIDEIRQLADATYRKAPIRVAPSQKKTKLTADKMDQIDVLAATYAHMPMRDIAQRVGTDQGRVSEYLSGKIKRPNLELVT